MRNHGVAIDLINVAKAVAGAVKDAEELLARLGSVEGFADEDAASAGEVERAAVGGELRGDLEEAGVDWLAEVAGGLPCAVGERADVQVAGAFAFGAAAGHEDEHRLIGVDERLELVRFRIDVRAEILGGGVPLAAAAAA